MFGGELTEARRQVILGVISDFSGVGATLKEVMEELRAVHAAGKWPQGSMGGRNDPYDTGVRQHLKALVKRGDLDEHHDPALYHHTFTIKVAPAPPVESVTEEEAAKIEKRCGSNARAVLAALRDLGLASTAREVTQRVIDRGEWDGGGGHPTMSNTAAQRGEPYQGIVYQHLRNFVGRGLVEERPPAPGRLRPKLYVATPVVAGRGTEELVEQPRQMRKRAAEAIALRAQGTPEQRSFKQVGEAMGIATTYAHELCTDPYGDAARARKEARQCQTPGCTREAKDGLRRCNGCRTEIDGLMPTCRIERWVRQVAAERRITINFMLVETGKTTAPFARVIEVETPRGKIERTLKRGDTWSDGLGACGIDAA